MLGWASHGIILPWHAWYGVSSAFITKQFPKHCWELLPHTESNSNQFLMNGAFCCFRSSNTTVELPLISVWLLHWTLLIASPLWWIQGNFVAASQTPSEQTLYWVSMWETFKLAKKPPLLFSFIRACRIAGIWLHKPSSSSRDTLPFLSSAVPHHFMWASKSLCSFCFSIISQCSRSEYCLKMSEAILVYKTIIANFGKQKQLSRIEHPCTHFKCAFKAAQKTKSALLLVEPLNLQGCSC